MKKKPSWVWFWLHVLVCMAAILGVAFRAGYLTRHHREHVGLRVLLGEPK